MLQGLIEKSKNLKNREIDLKSVENKKSDERRED